MSVPTYKQPPLYIFSIDLFNYYYTCYIILCDCYSGKSEYLSKVLYLRSYLQPYTMQLFEYLLHVQLFSNIYLIVSMITRFSLTFSSTSFIFFLTILSSPNNSSTKSQVFSQKYLVLSFSFVYNSYFVAV